MALLNLKNSKRMKKIAKLFIAGVMILAFFSVKAQNVSPVDFMR